MGHRAGAVVLAIRGFMGAVNRPEPGLWITLVAIPANAVLVYLLIHGAWGLPRLELFGAGLATTMINFGMFLAALWFAHSRRPFRKYHVLGRIWRIDWTLMRQLIVDRRADLDLVPAGIRPVLRRRAADGPDQHHRAGGASDRAAGHRHPVHGAVRHRHGGHRAGRACRRPQRCGGVKRAGFVATLLGMALVSALTLAVILGRFAIARFFFGEAVESGGVVIELTATLLMVGATFFVADGIQTVAAGALRGMNDTRIPLLFAAISYWLIGFPAACGLALLDRMGRDRGLDRAVLRHRRLCRATGVAFPAAGQPAGISAIRGDDENPRDQTDRRCRCAAGRRAIRRRLRPRGRRPHARCAAGRGADDRRARRDGSTRW